MKVCKKDYDGIKIYRLKEQIFELKGKIKKQQAEINSLKVALEQIINDVEYGEYVDLESAKRALSGESEGE